MVNGAACTGMRAKSSAQRHARDSPVHRDRL